MEQTYKGNKYIFFWNGIFSNWYMSDFTIDNITYNCGEQYMMHKKALYFQDYKAASDVLKTDIPREQKKIGRKVKNYHNDFWCKVRFEIVKIGLKEKFNQNPDLKNYLLKYKDHIIVEASPYDRVWGIGYYDNEAISNIDNWGENLLGKVLMELANEL